MNYYSTSIKRLLKELAAKTFENELSLAFAQLNQSFSE
jgi:hypothetical protein